MGKKWGEENERRQDWKKCKKKKLNEKRRKEWKKCKKKNEKESVRIREWSAGRKDWKRMKEENTGRSVRIKVWKKVKVNGGHLRTWVKIEFVKSSSPADLPSVASTCWKTVFGKKVFFLVEKS